MMERGEGGEDNVGEGRGNRKIMEERGEDRGNRRVETPNEGRIWHI